MPNTALVLAYHSANVSGDAYHNNDHVALAADLRLIAASGWRFATLDEVVERVVLHDSPHGDERLVALSCDDGTTLDALDFDHPAQGHQRSFLGILQDFVAQHPDCIARAGAPHLSSFVIASPQAREQFDRKDFFSLGLWHDDWWAPAQRSGLMHIESHSWDHNHPTIDPTAHKSNERGSFLTIDTLPECEAEIRQASAYIAQRSGRMPRHLAYPWGQASDYLRGEYLPQFAAQLGLCAAWSCEPKLLVAGTRLDRWYLPRWVCGQDWKSAEQLQALLHEGAAAR